MLSDDSIEREVRKQEAEDYQVTASGKSAMAAPTFSNCFMSSWHFYGERASPMRKHLRRLPRMPTRTCTRRCMNSLSQFTARLTRFPTLKR